MTVAAILISALALLVATAQLRWHQRDSRRQRTLEHLRGIVRVVQAARHHEFHRAQEDALSFYSGTAEALSDAGRCHLLLLDEMDLLALGIKTDAVDGEITREYLRSTYAEHVADTIHFINRLRKRFDDPELYDHLYHILPTLPSPTPHWVTTYTPDTENRYERQEEAADVARPSVPEDGEIAAQAGETGARTSERAGHSPR